MHEQRRTEQRKIAESTRRGKTHASTSCAVQFVREGISGLLRELETLTKDGPAEASYAAVTGEIAEPPTLENRTRALPGWAYGKKNMQGLIQFSRSHFYGVVAVTAANSKEGKAMVGEAVIDSGGSKSLINADSAEQYGLEVTVGDVGYFWGPGNKAEPYYSKVEGPVTLQFNADLKMVLPELKVVRGTRTDPLFIAGLDIMTPEHPGALDFLNVGFNPNDKRGVMNFISGDG